MQMFLSYNAVLTSRVSFSDNEDTDARMHRGFATSLRALIVRRCNFTTISSIIFLPFMISFDMIHVSKCLSIRKSQWWKEFGQDFMSRILWHFHSCIHVYFIAATFKHLDFIDTFFDFGQIKNAKYCLNDSIGQENSWKIW